MDRYAAFISYSHTDQGVARWLHRALEAYRLPKALVGSESRFGAVPRRLPPVFRDRDELPASGDLGAELRAALAASRFQIVLCSPRAAASKWVNEEILSFKRARGEARTLALIVGGEPHSGGADECFPPALRFRLDREGALSDAPAEPIAADLRPGKDGRRLALLKLVAGLTGLSLDALARRDAARRQRRLMLVTAASLAVAVLTIGLAIYADGQRRVAESQRRIADRNLAFLIDTFSIADPATENPRTITVLSVLDRVSRRAGGELGGEPAVAARLLRTTGDIYFNLGLRAEAARDLRAALALEPARSAGRAHALLTLAEIADARGDAGASLSAVEAAARAYDRGGSDARALDARVAEQRATIEVLNGRPAAAAAGFARAARLYRALGGDNREAVGRVLMREGQARSHLGEVREARALLAAATALYVARFGADHVRTAAAVQNQALADFEAGDLARAERRVGRAAAIYGRVYEGDHPTVAAALILTGRIRTARGDAAGALAALDRARGIYARLYGPGNAAVGDVDFYAAEAEARRGRTDAALARAARTEAIYDARYGPDDPDQVELMLLRSRILAGGGRIAEARRACGDALALQTRINPEGLPETRRACAAVGIRSESRDAAPIPR